MSIKIHDLRECADVLEMRAPKWLAELRTQYQTLFSVLARCLCRLVANAGKKR